MHALAALTKPSGAMLAMATLMSSPACRKAGAPGLPAYAPLGAEVSWGGLRVRTWGERRDPQQIVVLLHGWGAPGDDLVPLGQVLRSSGRLFLFPEAPLVSPGGGRAWWHLDIDRLMKLRERGGERDLRQEQPQGLVEAHDKVRALIDEAKRHFGLPASQVVLGGFSQGAMLATDVALGLEATLGGLVVLSGTFLAEPRWRAQLARPVAPFPVLLSHGHDDPILPFYLAEELSAVLREARLPVTWIPFAGGHEIPREVLAETAAFLKAVSPSPTSAAP